LKAANKQYSNLNNEYEMTFRDSTEVLPCNDESSSIPTLQFSFVKISDLVDVQKDSLVDVIGVCRSAGDVATIISSKTQKEMIKRDIVIVDKSSTEVGLTLWGGKAESFDGSDNPIVCIKGAKVSDYNGVSLSVLSSSVVQVLLFNQRGKTMFALTRLFSPRSTPICKTLTS
jgi:replication factor A1